MAATTVAIPVEALKLAPLGDEGLPEFPERTKHRQALIAGLDERLKTRDEFWLDGVLIYAREYDQAMYGDPT